MRKLMPSSPQANIKENKQPVQIAKSIKDLEKILKNVGPPDVDN